MQMEKGFPTLLYSFKVQIQKGRDWGRSGRGTGTSAGREREMDHSNPVTSVNRSIMGIKCSSMAALPPAREEHLTGVP